MSYSDQELTKITSNLDQIMTGDSSNDPLETIDYIVFGSSLHLFKNIKQSLMRCISFSKGKALFNLQLAFINVFSHYIKLLKKKLPVKAFEENQNSFALNEEQEMKCVYLINTSEYCLEIIPQLH